MNSRFKNYVLWVAVAAFILDILIYAHVITVSDKATIQELVQRALELLVGVGILNNPSVGVGLSDKPIDNQNTGA